MASCTTCLVAGVVVREVGCYEADLLGAPFRVILENGVREELCSVCGKKLETIIPALENLLRTVARNRALRPRKLSGEEIKFLRHAMGWKSKRLAQNLGLSAEHLSRCENGIKRLSDPVEKWLRVFVLHKMVKKEIRESVDIDEVMDMKIEAMWDASHPFELRFAYRPPVDDELPDDAEADWELEAA